MVEYKCDGCNKTYINKYDYTRHINRKNPCLKEIVKSSQNEPNVSQAEAKIAKIDKNSIQCNYCKRVFTLKSSLNKHLQDRCKVKKEDINTKEEIYQTLLKQMKEMEENNKKQIQIIEENSKKQIQIMENTNKKMLTEIIELTKQINKSNTTINNTNNGTVNTIENQNNNTNNQQNNIKNLHINLIAHGKEDLSFITEDHLKKILYKGFKSIENLTQIVHFDKNRPENHNIYISNIKDTYVMMYDGEDWKLIDREKCLTDIYDEKSDYLVEKFEELEDKLDEQTMKRFGNFLSRKDDDKIIEQTKREIKLILYNNRKIPEETRRLLRLNDENIIDQLT